MTHYCTCGYSHYNSNGVKFISRYQDENDYCVNGRRVHVHDNGRTNATDSERELIIAHLTAEHNKYVAWHAQQVAKFGGDFPALMPFACVLTPAEVA